MKEFIDKTIEQSGTPLNRATMMAIQGFSRSRIEFLNDGSVVETNENGETLTTSFGEDGSITETLVGEKTIIKTTSFNDDGSIEVTLA